MNKYSQPQNIQKQQFNQHTFSKASLFDDCTKIWFASAVFVSLWASILLLFVSLLLLQYKPLSFRLLWLFDNDDRIEGEQPITMSPLILRVFVCLVVMIYFNASSNFQQRFNLMKISTTSSCHHVINIFIIFCRIKNCELCLKTFSHIFLTRISLWT